MNDSASKAGSRRPNAAAALTLSCVSVTRPGRRPTIGTPNIHIGAAINHGMHSTHTRHNGGCARRSLVSAHSPCLGCSSSSPAGALSPHNPAAGSPYGEVANIMLSRWSGAPRPVTQRGSLPGRPLKRRARPAALPRLRPHLVPPGRGAHPGLGGYLLGLGLGDPWADDGGVCPGLEAGPVLADLGVVLGDAGAGGSSEHGRRWLRPPIMSLRMTSWLHPDKRSAIFSFTLGAAGHVAYHLLEQGPNHPGALGHHSRVMPAGPGPRHRHRAGDVPLSVPSPGTAGPARFRRSG